MLSVWMYVVCCYTNTTGNCIGVDFYDNGIKLMAKVNSNFTKLHCHDKGYYFSAETGTFSLLYTSIHRSQKFLRTVQFICLPALYVNLRCIAESKIKESVGYSAVETFS